MEKDFDYTNDEAGRKIIDMLTPKYLTYTMKLKNVARRNHAVVMWKKISAIAAIVTIVAFIGINLFQPNSAYSMPATSKEVLTNAIKAVRELKSISLEFDARIQSVTPDYAECSSGGTPTKCKYRYILDEGDIIQRVDFDFDSIKVCNIYINDTVYMWKDKELLYNGIKESPTGLKGIVKMENVLKKFSDYNDIKLENKEEITILRHKTSINGGTLVTEGCFDNKTGLLNSCKNFFVCNDTVYPIAESVKMEYNVPIDKNEMLFIP